MRCNFTPASISNQTSISSRPRLPPDLDLDQTSISTRPRCPPHLDFHRTSISSGLVTKRPPSTVLLRVSRSALSKIVRFGNWEGASGAAMHFYISNSATVIGLELLLSTNPLVRNRLFYKNSKTPRQEGKRHLHFACFCIRYIPVHTRRVLLDCDRPPVAQPPMGSPPWAPRK